MKKIRVLCAVILTILFVAGVAAQTNAENGTVVEQGDCWTDPFTGYEMYVGAMRGRFTRETEAAKTENFKVDYMADFEKRIMSKDEFARRKAFVGLECRRVKYMSDGLKIVGIIWKPKDTTGKKLPLVIYNRGGNRDLGKLVFAHNYILHPFLANGFVVIGSQYRGNDGGEGKEEFGGADVNDVMNLIPLARSLGYVDMNNVFMFGESRGGMETYLALKNKIPVNAAATVGGLADLVTGLDNRPELIVRVYKPLIPDFDSKRDEVTKARSAVYFADKINTPLLILQGADDWRSDTGNQALALAQKLQSFGKTYELIVYAGDDHGLSLNRADGERRIVGWFKKHMK